jgi:hypothetical protein
MDKGQIVEKVAAAIYADGNPEWAKTWNGESTEDICVRCGYVIEKAAK